MKELEPLPLITFCFKKIKNHCSQLLKFTNTLRESKPLFLTIFDKQLTERLRNTALNFLSETIP